MANTKNGLYPDSMGYSRHIQKALSCLVSCIKFGGEDGAQLLRNELKTKQSFNDPANIGNEGIQDMISEI